ARARSRVSQNAANNSTPNIASFTIHSRILAVPRGSPLPASHRIARASCRTKRRHARPSHLPARSAFVVSGIAFIAITSCQEYYCVSRLDQLDRLEATKLAQSSGGFPRSSIFSNTLYGSDL